MDHRLAAFELGPGGVANVRFARRNVGQVASKRATRVVIRICPHHVVAGLEQHRNEHGTDVSPRTCYENAHVFISKVSTVRYRSPTISAADAFPAWCPCTARTSRAGRRLAGR